MTSMLAGIWKTPPPHSSRSPSMRAEWPSVHQLSAAYIIRRLGVAKPFGHRSEEHTSELQSLMRISYAVFCLKKKKSINNIYNCELRLQHTNTSITVMIK